MIYPQKLTFQIQHYANLVRAPANPNRAMRIHS
jgi:hypothetical protein